MLSGRYHRKKKKKKKNKPSTEHPVAVTAGQDNSSHSVHVDLCPHSHTNSLCLGWWLRCRKCSQWSDCRLAEVKNLNVNVWNLAKVALDHTIHAGGQAKDVEVRRERWSAWGMVRALWLVCLMLNWTSDLIWSVLPAAVLLVRVVWNGKVCEGFLLLWIDKEDD